MAEQPDKKPRIRKAPTMRQKAEEARSKTEKPRRIRSAAGKVKSPVHKTRTLLGKEYYLPMPDNKVGRFLNKRRHYFPSYFRNSWAELKQVTWPGRRETFKLMWAVVVFAAVFGLVVSLVDTGLDKVVEKVILK